MVCAICLLIPGILIGMLSHEPAIIAAGQKALRVLSLAYPLSGVAVMVAAYFQSLGRAKDALLLTLGGMLLVKLPVLLLGARLFGLDGIWASEVVSELILCAVALLDAALYAGASGLGTSQHHTVKRCVSDSCCAHSHTMASANDTITEQ